MNDEMDYEDDTTTTESAPDAIEVEDKRSVKIQRTVTQVSVSLTCTIRFDFGNECKDMFIRE